MVFFLSCTLYGTIQIKGQGHDERTTWFCKVRPQGTILGLNDDIIDCYIHLVAQKTLSLEDDLKRKSGSYVRGYKIINHLKME